MDSFSDLQDELTNILNDLAKIDEEEEEEEEGIKKKKQNVPIQNTETDLTETTDNTTKPIKISEDLEKPIKIDEEQATEQTINDIIRAIVKVNEEKEEEQQQNEPIEELDLDNLDLEWTSSIPSTK